MTLIRMTDQHNSIFACLLLMLIICSPASVIADESASPEAPPLGVDLPEIERPSFDIPAEPDRPPARPAPLIDLEYGLAGQFISTATAFLMSPPLTVQSIQAALLFAQEAADLTPDDPEAWYTLLSIAELAERNDLIRAAIERLVVLDEGNDKILLRKLRAEIEEEQTAAARAARYEAEISREDRPPTVRSRLALDLAILERRRGRVDSFAAWLAESVSLDRSHTAAAALAAGYFRLHVDDPVGTGELLLNQFLANPTDISAQVLAANHFLDHGAYIAAERLYSLARTSYESLLMITTPEELIADIAIARWGAGRAEDALEVILQYQRRQDIHFRERLLFQEPDLTPMERAERHAPVPLALAVTGAALRTRQGQDDGPVVIQQILERQEQHIHEMIDSVREDGVASDDRVRSAIAQAWLEAAWLSVWFSASPEDGERFLQKAAEWRELPERTEARINGWIALRSGEYVRAAELLQPHAEHDAAAGLGYANALLRQGQRRSAAQQLLRVTRREPGTLIGVWAGDQLAELLGRSVPISNEAARLNDLMDEVPRYIDRFPTHPTTVFSVRARPVKARYDPFEPIMVHLEVRNHTSRPLSIDPEGPVLPDVALLLDVRVTGVAEHPTIAPIIVSIDRRLRLEPHQRLIVPIDLRRTALGTALHQNPLAGAVVTMRTVSNFFVTPQRTIAPNLLGSESRTTPITIDGSRMTAEIVNRMIREVTESPGSATAPQMTMLLWFFAAYSHQDLTSQQVQQLMQMLLAFGETYRQLDPVSQAWLLTTLPTRTAAVRPILEVARRIDSRMVKICLLLYGRHALDEADLRAYLEQDDDRLRRLARLYIEGAEELDFIFGEVEEQPPSALDEEFPTFEREGETDSADR